MPYIKLGLRAALDDKTEIANRPGELNYLITKVVTDYLGHFPDYQSFNDAIGALECAKLELYRRMVAPYEDKKCAENGDVY